MNRPKGFGGFRAFGGGDRGVKVQPFERVGRFHLSDLASNESHVGLSNLCKLIADQNCSGGSTSTGPLARSGHPQFTHLVFVQSIRTSTPPLQESACWLRRPCGLVNGIIDSLSRAIIEGLNKDRSLQPIGILVIHWLSFSAYPNTRSNNSSDSQVSSL
jgi:hypothetical protein